jgi:hypothetical protein
MAISNRRVVLASRPEGTATPDNFRVEDVDLPPLDDGQVRVAVEYVSVDAGTRTMLRGEGFHMQVPMGETIYASGVGRVIESRAEPWRPGDAVRGPLGAQTVATVPGSMLSPIDESVADLKDHLGILSGSTGVTAWIGMRELAKVQPGEQFVVSAAAGAVGSVVGQIAKRDGARVIGIAGGPDKCAHLVDVLGFDAALDYKRGDLGDQLREACPDGVDVFFDNVGGDVLDAVLDNLAMHARVVICGAVSQYDDMDHVVGPSMYLRLAERQARMEGFAYFHFPDDIPVAMEELSRWLAEGSITLPETILEGIDRYPEALQFMFSGGNVGKLMVKAVRADA